MARLQIAGKIDFSQFQAGRHFQRAWDNAGSFPKAIDIAKDVVDGGRLADPLSDGKAWALMDLRHARAKLGQDGYNLATYVLGQGYTLEQVSHSEWHARQLGRVFRDGVLETLAILWGYAQPRRTRY